MAPNSNTQKPRLKIRALSAAVATCFAAAPAWSLTETDLVKKVNGTATFNQVGNVLTIANSNGAILEWARFGIPAGEMVKFDQAASSSVLNRVLAGGGLSAIYGTLQSSGRVWLVNPAGILVGPGGTIDTASFIASTLAIRNEDFLAGKLTFSGPGGNVINQGVITTPTGGSVYLIGANVSNEGVITTPKGETLLAAGQTVNLVDTSTPGVKIEITGAAGNATNLGTIAAEAGRIGMAGVIVRNSGALNASSAVEEGGKVFLRASQDTYVDGNGRIVATGTKGGRVEVLGNRVAVMDSAAIDASGTNGGGTVLVGGDYQGNNPAVRNSQITYFGPNASIKANAVGSGDGGKVIVWADDTTRAYGHIEARGGANGGNGGFVEVSGKRYLDYQALTDTRAPQGTAGTLLLDPEEITVYPSGSDTTTSWYGAGAYFFDSYGGTPATLSWTTINSNLALGSVKLQSGTYQGYGGNITFTPGTYISTYNNVLDLRAYHPGSPYDNTVGNINLSGAYINLVGDFYAFAGWDNLGSSVRTGYGNLNVSGSTIQANSINLIAGNYLQISNSTLNATGSGMNMLGLAGGYGVYSSGTSMTAANGSVMVNSTYGGIFLGSSSITSGYGGTAINLTAYQGSIGVGTLNATGSGGGAYVYAGYSILDDNGSGVTNINANGGTIYLNSTFGAGPYSGIGISMDTGGTPGAIYASVGSGSTNGGISIRHSGNAPASVQLTDNSTNPYENFVEFRASGDINLTGSHSFTSYGGDIWIEAAGNLTAGGATFAGNPSEIGLYAGNTLNVNQSLSVSNMGGAYYPFIGLVAGSTINVNGSLYSAGEIGMVAGITLDKLDKLDNVDGPADLASFLISTGGTININAPVEAYDSIGMMAGNINLTGSSGYVKSYYGDIFGVVGGDITLSDGASITAGYDVYLGLLGPTSTLYLNKTTGLAPSYIVADGYSGMPYSVNLGFPTRSSGGIVIDGIETSTSTPGGSGLFVLNHDTPATPGAGLNIYYGQTQLDSGVSNTLTNTVTGTTDLNTDGGVLLPPPPPPGGTQTAGLDGQSTGGGEGEFGGKEGDKENGKDGDKKSDDSQKRGKKPVRQCKG